MDINFLEQTEKRFTELESLITNASVIATDPNYSSYLKEHGTIMPLAGKYREYKRIKQQLSDLLLIEDVELAQLTEEENKELNLQLKTIEPEIENVLSQKDKQEAVNSIVMEIRAGTGGDEAALFAADLFRMYTRYCERKGFKMELLSSHATGLKGLKEIIFSLEGDDIYSYFKNESGAHRVQRIPLTEASGRIHTSTATVAVLPEPKEVDLEIKTEDLRIDTYRASGHGGQHLQKTDSAVRITHIPSGLVVQCQDERSQGRNRQKAFRLLLVRLTDLREKTQASELSQERRTQIGSAKRSEKIRTYNYPQNRITDHRAGVSFHNLETVMEGELNDLIMTVKKEIELKKNDTPVDDETDE